MQSKLHEKYGVPDVEEYADSVQAALPNDEHLALVIMDELSEAIDDVRLHPDAACQRLRRVQFLITRHCPVHKAACALAAAD